MRALFRNFTAISRETDSVSSACDRGANEPARLGAFLSGKWIRDRRLLHSKRPKNPAAMARAATAPARTIIAHADNHGAQVLPIRNPPSPSAIEMAADLNS